MSNPIPDIPDIIPKHLRSEISILYNVNGQRIFLLGTAHISKQSSLDAAELVHSIKPSAVFLELCDQRQGILTNDVNSFKEDIKTEEIIKRLIKGEDNLFAVIYSYLLKEIAKDLEVIPGGEFRAAYEAGNIYNSLIVLGDRPAGITLKRLWQGLSFYEKIKVLFSFFFGNFNNSSNDIKNMIEEIKNDKNLLMKQIEQLGQEFPWVLESLVYERDRYMSLQLNKALDTIESGDVVAIVGSGHVSGIVKFWNENQKLIRSKQESEEMLDSLLLFPDGEHYSVKELRNHAVKVSHDYKMKIKDNDNNNNKGYGVLINYNNNKKVSYTRNNTNYWNKIVIFSFTKLLKSI